MVDTGGGSPLAAGSRANACTNCGASAARRFCPECGQRQDPEIHSLRHWSERFIDEYLSLDGRFPRSMGALLFRPGFLSRECFEGRRVRYSRPARLFFLTGAFFVAVIITAGEGAGGGSFLPRLMPVLILASIPLLALVVRLLERAGAHSFVEHLVFTVHLQAFGFVILAAMAGEAALKGTGADAAELGEGALWATYYSALFLWCAWYMVAAFRRAYDDGWWRSVLNAVALSLAWSILVPVTAGLLGGAVAGVGQLLGA